MRARGIIAFAAKRDDIPDGRAPGIEAVMAGGLWDLPPLAPLKGGIIRVLLPVPAGHCSGKPDGAAAL